MPAPRSATSTPGHAKESDRNAGPAERLGQARPTGQLTLPGGSLRNTVPNPGSGSFAGMSILQRTLARGTK